ncbi:MAG: glycosyltransferase [Patescibacteria group bacterium]
MKISIIIPNRNGAALLRKNLPSVIVAAKGAEIIVVDDASTDDSLNLLSNTFSSVRVVPKSHHDGYASTVNAGVKASQGDVVVLLNSDVRPEKAFLDPLVKRFDDPAVFAVGCLEKSAEGNATVLRGRGEAAWKRGFFVHWRGEVDRPSTAWVAGGSGAFRKAIWEKLGGMDTIYDPFYWEDIDLSYRALKAGYGLEFEPKSVVAHEHETGVIKREYSEFQVKIVVYRNQFLFIWKNLSDLNILLAHAIWTPIRLTQAIIRGDLAMLIGYTWALLCTPKAISSRIQSYHYWKLKDGDLRLR